MINHFLEWIKRFRFIRMFDAGGCRNYFVYNIRTYTLNRYVRIALKILVIPLTIMRYFFHGDTSVSGREGLAVVVIVKNEAPYIEEWINFHRKQGALHIIIYDNESTDNLHEVLKPYIDSGFVSYHLIRGRQRQVDAYNMALADYGRRFRYMAVIDADEFVFVRNSRVWGGVSIYRFVDEFMNEHPNAGGIAVNILTFGSNGHITKPTGGVLENYTRCASLDYGANRAVKTICDPMKVLGFGGVHNPFYKRGFYNLGEDGSIVTGVLSKEVHFGRIRINHYFTKSKEEFISKRNRGKADKLDIRPMEDFDAYDRNECEDTEILSHI